MLNGQLPLTDLTFPAACAARLPRAVWLAGMFSLALLAGCSVTKNRAPVVDLSNQPAATAQPGGTYVVKPGDTLYQIARANNVDIDNLKRLNNISDPNQLAVGQVLKLSGTATSTATAPTTPAPAPATETKPIPLGEPETPAATPPAETPAPVPTPPRASDASLINWGWPSSGPVTQTFNSSTKGIDIGGSLGDPVTAAADGKVMYSGNGVRGLGNLIIINHQNGFITAYAHNQTLLVKTGQTVKRGTKIAEVGQTDTTSPRLHFEIRRQGTPVDPLQYLPSR
ncbi:peptidoglycan DD-metalloendopeptidase family protein [Bordetella sp. BOR01]|uniref:peptidoglycan DD-metalloendopeptidase family protein n=1 Tax=Bordetella sp. BOR01 TaxID=2854779 RepID=UPI001C454A68|nr:peptidoglycan DD-metalloendopeptidase family protein [Bordetella sp. BOR01]MBV7485923.1 peptidoglycan DD-metalloendopeptidase family protein [Bordetella sp. BOR01]